jgi:hypothetical protein
MTKINMNEIIMAKIKMIKIIMEKPTWWNHLPYMSKMNLAKINMNKIIMAKIIFF